MPQRTSFPARLAAAGLCAALGLPFDAMADSDHRRIAPQLPLYQQECGACHTPYPAGMLPAASWQRLMSNLKRHFGADASLDPAAQKELAVWLGANAGTYKRVSGEPPQDRITLSPWFARKHNAVRASDWKLPAVKTASNCTACHGGAAQGDFSERNVKIPR
jgi:hypothetical protein